ncbi:MAG: PCRF domain-containing protein, partial [bacterium]|nr:PCRF domain-containing protein [bacterium]
MNPLIEEIKNEYAEISAQLNSPELFSDMAKMAQLGKRQAELSDTITKIEALEKIAAAMKGNAEIINTDEDPEMKQMAMDENMQLAEEKEKLEKELELILIPKDPNDDKNIIVEIR